MRKTLLLFFCAIQFTAFTYCQYGWHACNIPAGSSRIDDLYMVNSQTGYAVAGDGRIMKTTDSGENWSLLLTDNSVYCRSVEFFNEQKGFVGAFLGPGQPVPINILRQTTNGGANWTDLTAQIPDKARRGGICGMAIADANTIYAGGNWFQDSGYIIKSVDGGANWSLIDMSAYATSIIDLNFINKDTGFAVGKGTMPFEQAVVLYTTTGGTNWKIVYQGLQPNQYSWKIQRLTDRIYIVAIEDNIGNQPPRILRSLDGGQTWGGIEISPSPSRIQGAGFLNPLVGWAGGSTTNSFETKDAGKTWSPIAACPSMNRVFRVNDTTILASGTQIWKYKNAGLYPAVADPRFASMNCVPNPVRDILTINVALEHPTRLSLLIYSGDGKKMKVVDNSDRPRGSYQFYADTRNFPKGLYYVVLATHEDRLTEKIIVGQ